MSDFKYDIQILIDVKNLDENDINDYFTDNFKVDCLLVVGDEEINKDTLSYKRVKKFLSVASL